MLRYGDFAERFVQTVLWQRWIQLPQRRAQPLCQNCLAKTDSFSRQFIRRNFRPVQHRKAKLSEPCQRGVFDSGFGEFHAALIGSAFTLTDSGLTSVSPRA